MKNNGYPCVPFTCEEGEGLCPVHAICASCGDTGFMFNIHPDSYHTAMAEADWDKYKFPCPECKVDESKG